ncbi:MAG: hypothetical protein ACXWIU_13690 [Limisphaerales bacterium]
MKWKIAFFATVFLASFQAAANTQVKLLGADAHVVMDAFKELGHTISYTNPL